ncbi:DNA-binding protein BIN4 isoform X2 [Ricinus communis]|nr:DNA-binding protein BIN4 isoform X2 [Ricinus communis]
MSSSRENSPDWLHCFQAPIHSTVTLSSDSDSLPNVSPSRGDQIDSQSPKSESGAQSPSNQILKAKAPKRGPVEDETLTANTRKKNKKAKEKQGDEADGQDTEEATTDTHIESHAAKRSIWALSSDSESCPDDSSQRKTKSNQPKESRKEKDAILVDNSVEKALKGKSPKKLLKVEGRKLKKKENKNDDVPKTGDNDDVEVADEDVSEKHTGPQVSTSMIPLLLSDKVSRTKALVECEGESIDLSGDMGAVGRVVIPDGSSGNHEMYLDLKGTIYRTKIVPSRTFCVVSFGQSEAKIEAIMNDFIQLKAQSNVYEAETMVEGTLEGFSFDSEDEAEKMPKPVSHQTDQNDGNEEQMNGKTKRKAKKSSGAAQKKGKTGGGKPRPAKKVKKKAQVPKKAKTRK